MTVADHIFAAMHAIEKSLTPEELALHYSPPGGDDAEGWAAYRAWEEKIDTNWRLRVLRDLTAAGFDVIDQQITRPPLTLIRGGKNDDDEPPPKTA
jgi:hypothetical protein